VHAQVDTEEGKWKPEVPKFAAYKHDKSKSHLKYIDMQVFKEEGKPALKKINKDHALYIEKLKQNKANRLAKQKEKDEKIKGIVIEIDDLEKEPTIPEPKKLSKTIVLRRAHSALIT